jgi:hypothetical protein
MANESDSWDAGFYSDNSALFGSSDLYDFISPGTAPGGGSSTGGGGSARDFAAEPPQIDSNVASVSVRQPMLIKNGSVRLDTAEFDEDEWFIRSVVTRANGFTERSEISSITNRDGVALKRGTFTFRIPTEYFEWALAEFEGTGKLVSTSSSATDASAEYFDTQGRLDMRRLQEERVLDIMRSATTVADLLQLERQLAEIRSDLEFMQRRLNNIDALTAFSTIHVTLFEVLPEDIEEEDEEEKEKTVWSRMAASFSTSVTVVKAFFSFVMVAAAGLVVPFMILGAVAGVTFLIIKVSRKKRGE